METKFTPGPWTVSGWAIYADAAKNSEINKDGAIAVIVNGTENAWIEVANSRLIAAAPELFKALSEIDKWSRRQNIALPTSKIYEALAKARGEQ